MQYSQSFSEYAHEFLCVEFEVQEWVFLLWVYMGLGNWQFILVLFDLFWIFNLFFWIYDLFFLFTFFLLVIFWFIIINELFDS